MQHGLTETFKHESQNNPPQFFPSPSSQDGFQPRVQPGLPNAPQPRSRSLSQGSERSGASAGSFDIGRVDLALGRLSIGDADAATPSRLTAAGQRILEYENAVSGSSSRQPPHPTLFRVVKRPGSPSSGVRLTAFPNEILTHIISHVHPDSHSAVALVSKRFYALVTTPYAWRAAFLRFFPGHDALVTARKPGATSPENDAADVIRSESRVFTRLTSLASWRSEYLLRTRLLRSVARGKPGGAGSVARLNQSGKKAGAVLTYNSKLPWMVTNIHATFTGGKKGPRAVHGTADLGMCTVSDPTTGKIEKFGLDDPFSFAQLDEMFPNLEPFGIGDGPAVVYNVMDVSQPYGMVGGEGFPGGRAYFRASGQLRGKYLGQDSAIIDMAPEIPKIPELTEAICSVWIAKSSNVPSTTQSMVGVLTGSTLGVVTAYALGYDSTGPRFSNGDMTARWILSPGVPIVDIKVDDKYNQRRKTLGRVWAVVLNALGEVFYLTETPTPPLARAKAENMTKEAWHAGKTVYWQLIEQTRRIARPDEFDKNATRGAYSPRSPCNSMGLSREQTIAESREIEKFLRYTPAHFRSACQGWDMRRNLEVDFASGDETGIGEAIFVITCGHEQGEPASLVRLARGSFMGSNTPASALTPVTQIETTQPSIFGGPESVDATNLLAPEGEAGSQSNEAASRLSEEWQCSEFSLKNLGSAEITASAIDMSTFATLAAFEDPLHSGSMVAVLSAPSTPTSKNATGEIPGRRGRLLAVGTDTGAIIAWNTRDTLASAAVAPVRVIQTESPEVTCVAVSSLYLVHGGSDGLVQAWDPLASSLEPIRTLSAKSSGRIPRHILNANPALQDANYFAVRAIFLDPDPAALRGILSFGTFLRFWTYSSSGQAPGRKRRPRHSDIHGRLATRRHGGTVSSYIAAEEAELRHEQEHRSRELDRLRKRFGVGLGELTEEEAIQYAQMISEEAFLQDETRRLSASDTGSAGDIGETASSTGSIDTVTPEPSLSGASSSHLPPLQEEIEDDYEAQIQRAIRLSLLEGVNDEGQSPRGQSSGEYEFQVKIKTKDKKKGKGSPSVSPFINTPVASHSGTSREAECSRPAVGVDEDEDLALALQLSLAEEEARQGQASQADALDSHWEDYPVLEAKGKGKGKGV